MPDLTPTQLADLDQVHAEGQEALGDLIEAHRIEVARHGEVLATAYLELHLAEQPHDVAAGYAAHAVTRLVRVEADLASLGHWWCPNCEAVADVIDDDFCLRCSSQVEWAEPETLTSVKAYAAKLKRARDEAWAARDAANADLAQVTAQRDDALQMLGDLKPEGLARPRVQLLVWDWREQLDLAKLARAITALTGGQLHLIDVEDTGTQDYAIVLSTAPLDQEAATDAYRRHREGEPMPAG